MRSTSGVCGASPDGEAQGGKHLERSISKKNRRVSTTNRLKNRLEVIKYMLDEEKRDEAKKPEDIYIAAIAEFPDVFTGKGRANRNNARYWWNRRHLEDMSLLASSPGQACKDLEKKARSEHAGAKSSTSGECGSGSTADDGARGGKDFNADNPKLKHIASNSHRRRIRTKRIKPHLRLEAVQYMLDVEKKGEAKKPEDIYMAAVAEFPHLFPGTLNSNKQKARCWWNGRHRGDFTLLTPGIPDQASKDQKKKARTEHDTAMSSKTDGGGCATADGGSQCGQDLNMDTRKLENITSNNYRQKTTTKPINHQYEVVKYMLDEEKKGKATNDYEIYFAAIAKFPDFFQGNDNGNKAKARYWWNQRHREDLHLSAPVTMMTIKQRYEIITFMLEEEEKDKAKKPTEICSATIAEFPDLFLKSRNANMAKARYWWDQRHRTDLAPLALGIPDRVCSDMEKKARTKDAASMSSTAAGDSGATADGVTEDGKDLYAGNSKLERFTSKQYQRPPHLVPNKNRWEITEWMLQEDKKDNAKHPREIYYAAMTEFPECFQGSDESNNRKARNLWNERHRGDLPLLALTIPDQTSRRCKRTARTEEAREAYDALYQRLKDGIFTENIDNLEQLLKIGLGVLFQYPTVAKRFKKEIVGRYMNRLLKEKEARKILEAQGIGIQDDEEEINHAVDNYKIDKNVNDVDDNNENHMQLTSLRSICKMKSANKKKKRMKKRKKKRKVF